MFKLSVLVRHLRVLVCIILLVVPINLAFSLSLGEFRVESYLGQPLVGEIAIFNGQSLDAETLTVTLAPLSEYQKLEIEYENYVQSLMFSLIKSKRAHNIPVVGSQPLIKPYFQFAVKLTSSVGLYPGLEICLAQAGSVSKLSNTHIVESAAFNRAKHKVSTAAARAKARQAVIHRALGYFLVRLVARGGLQYVLSPSMLAVDSVGEAFSSNGIDAIQKNITRLHEGNQLLNVQVNEHIKKKLTDEAYATYIYWLLLALICLLVLLLTGLVLFVYRLYQEKLRSAAVYSDGEILADNGSDIEPSSELDQALSTVPVSQDVDREEGIIDQADVLRAAVDEEDEDLEFEFLKQVQGLENSEPLGVEPLATGDELRHVKSHSDPALPEDHDLSDSPIKQLLLNGPSKPPLLVEKAVKPLRVYGQALSRAIDNLSNGEPQALFYIEIDDMDNLEAQFGPLVTEQLAQNIGANLLNVLGVIGANLVRLKDATYTHVQPYRSDQELMALAKKLMEKIKSTDFNINTYKVSSSISIGVVPINGLFTSVGDYLLCGKKTVRSAPGQSVNNLAMFVHNLPEGDWDSSEELKATVSDFIHRKKLEPVFQALTNVSGKYENLHTCKIELAEDVDESSLPERFLDKILRSKTSLDIDKYIVTHAIQELVDNKYLLEHKVLLRVHQTAINDPLFPQWLDQKLTEAGIDNELLIVFLDEYYVAEQMMTCWRFAANLKALNIDLGIVNFGATEKAIDIIHELKPSIVRFDFELVNLSIKTSKNIDHLVYLVDSCHSNHIETIITITSEMSLPEVWQFNIETLQSNYIQNTTSRLNLDVVDV